MRTKINQSDVNNREYLNETYSTDRWDRDFEEARKRIREVVGLLGEYKKILSIGCADGTFIKEYLKIYPESQCYGLDISDVAIGKAKVNCPTAEFTIGECVPLPYPDNSFDLVEIEEVMEHMADPERVIEEIKRVLRVGGEVVLTTPENNYDVEHLWRWDLSGVEDLFAEFTVLDARPNFYNGHIIYIKARK